MSCNYCKESSKTSPENETICYCNNIRRLEIEKTIRETGLKTISEIKKHLRDKIISNCAELNPTGRCCHQSFNAIIQQVLENS